MKKERRGKEGKGRGEREKEGERKEAVGGRGEGCKGWPWGVYDPGGAWKGRIVIAVSMLGLKIPRGICK